MKLVWFSLLAVAIIGVAAEDDLCLDIMVKGKHVTAPCLVKGLTEIPSERKELDNILIGKLKVAFHELINSSMRSTPSMFNLRYLPTAVFLFLKDYKNQNQILDEKNVAVKSSIKFVHETIGMIKTILNRANYQAKLDKQTCGNSCEIPVTRVTETLKSFVDFMTEVTLNSPTGVYIDYSNMMIDDDPFIDIATFMAGITHFNESTELINWILGKMIKRASIRYLD